MSHPVSSQDRIQRLLQQQAVLARDLQQVESLLAETRGSTESGSWTGSNMTMTRSTSQLKRPHHAIVDTSHSAMKRSISTGPMGAPTMIHTRSTGPKRQAQQFSTMCEYPGVQPPSAMMQGYTGFLPPSTMEDGTYFLPQTSALDCNMIQHVTSSSSACSDVYTSYLPGDFISTMEENDSHCGSAKRMRTSFDATVPLPSMMLSTQSTHLLSPSLYHSPSTVSSFYSQRSSVGNPAGMSRQNSRSSASTTGLCAPMDMLKVNSNRSEASMPLYSYDEQPLHDAWSSTSTVHAELPAETLSMDSNSELLLECIGTGIDDVQFQQPSEQQDNFDLIDLPISQEMRREVSNQSNSSTSSRAKERLQKQVENAKQDIKPKLPVESTASSDSEKQQIAKATYKRPQHDKPKCPYCAAHPDGFHGPHELARHIERAHMTERKVWICAQSVTTPPDELPTRSLDKCNHCRDQKQYNAYYNAAAHIRRAHFNPRKRGRRPRGGLSESRAGKAGGDHPRIDWLKLHGWIMEVTIKVAPPDQLFDPSKMEDVSYTGDVLLYNAVDDVVSNKAEEDLSQLWQDDPDNYYVGDLYLEVDDSCNALMLDAEFDSRED